MNTRDHLVGRVLDGRYEIVSRLARGGMATVYLATDRRLTRTVAIKVMHEGLGDDQDFARKFDREARAVARLAHPNIVSVFDQGLDGGRPYIVMEYVEGRTLRSVIALEAPLDPIRALDLIEPVVAAVAAAHESGLIHRDIKPENVLISDRGRIKVVDFGLAKAITAQTVTASQGLLLGTVSYIAPELVTEGRPKPSSDVYSIGVVLFEMITGQKPHVGDNPIQVAYRHVHYAVPEPSSMLPNNWLTSRSAIPPYLDALVTCATAREFDQRPRDARVLLAHVRAARRALGAGIMNDPALTDRMSLRTIEEVEANPLSSPDTATTQRLPSTPTIGEALHASSHDARSNRVSGVDVAQEAATPTLVNSHSPVAESPESPVAPPRRATVMHPPRTKQAVYRRRRLFTLVTMLTVFALIIGGVSWWMLAGRYTTAPDLVSLTEPAAREQASAAQVTVSFTDAYSETVPAGQIISTDPAGGQKILRDGEMKATVSKGPERYAMPTLAGLTQQEAINALDSASLLVGKVTEQYNEKVAAGIVVSASQKSGTLLKKDTAIDLTVSLGPKPIAITNYVGKPLATAQQALKKSGFTVKVGTAQHSATVPAGSVVSQNPNSGNGKAGDTITLVGSLGPVMVKVPNVRSMSVERATAALAEVGLKSKVVNLVDNPLRLVVTTSPRAGTQAPEGSVVTLNVV